MCFSYLTETKTYISVPPKKVVIHDDAGQEVRDIAGPYKERSDITLFCEAQRGNVIMHNSFFKFMILEKLLLFSEKKLFLENKNSVLNLLKHLKSPRVISFYII